MTHHFGKTTDERHHYFNEGSQARQPWGVKRRVVEPSDMGETRVVAYVPSTIKTRLREVSDLIREHRTPELIADRDTLLLEAEAAGWTAAEMRAACRSSDANIRTRLKHAHALQTAGSTPTRLTG